MCQKYERNSCKFFVPCATPTTVAPSSFGNLLGLPRCKSSVAFGRRHPRQTDSRLFLSWTVSRICAPFVPGSIRSSQVQKRSQKGSRERTPRSFRCHSRHRPLDEMSELPKVLHRTAVSIDGGDVCRKLGGHAQLKISSIQGVASALYGSAGVRHA